MHRWSVMHPQVIINPAVTSPAANRRRVYFQADSLITVNFSWILFLQAHEGSASQSGGCLCLPKQPTTGGGWGPREGTEMRCEAAPGWWPLLCSSSPPPQTNPWAVTGAMVTRGWIWGEVAEAWQARGGGGGAPVGTSWLALPRSNTGRTQAFPADRRPCSPCCVTLGTVACLSVPS